MRRLLMIAVAAAAGCQFGAAGPGAMPLGSGLAGESATGTGSPSDGDAGDGATATSHGGGEGGDVAGDMAGEGGDMGGPVSTDGPGAVDTQGPPDDGDTGPTPDLPPEAGSSSDDGSPMGTTTGAELASYPSCFFGCPPHAPMCVDLGNAAFCSDACGDVGECPAPTSGTSPQICSASAGVCAIDCANGTCPTGMFCVDVGGGEHRCGWLL